MAGWKDTAVCEGQEGLGRERERERERKNKEKE
jgi:hypothetical protein